MCLIWNDICLSWPRGMKGNFEDLVLSVLNIFTLEKNSLDYVGIKLSECWSVSCVLGFERISKAIYTMESDTGGNKVVLPRNAPDKILFNISYLWNVSDQEMQMHTLISFCTTTRYLHGYTTVSLWWTPISIFLLYLMLLIPWFCSPWFRPRGSQNSWYKRSELCSNYCISIMEMMRQSKM